LAELKSNKHLAKTRILKGFFDELDLPPAPAAAIFVQHRGFLSNNNLDRANN